MHGRRFRLQEKDRSGTSITGLSDVIEAVSVGKAQRVATMKCKPGDLAVVLSAVHQSNVGKFVNVVRLYDVNDGVTLGGSRPVWLVRSHTPLTWRTGDKLWCAIRGPVPDASLQPIRGLAGQIRRSNRATLEKKTDEAN